MAMSGNQWIIGYGGREAVVAEVGGGLREFSVDGTSYVDGYGDDEIMPGHAGAVLAPWPGRVRDGRYEFAGTSRQLPIDDPDNNCALHGLTSWLRWRAADVSDSSVTMECALPAQPGYPFPLVLRTRWSLGPYGLRAAHTVSNVGTRPCPFGLGVHPYLRLGGELELSQWRLRVPAKTRLAPDERRLPAAEEPSGFDEPTPIGDAVLDHTFAELTRESDRTARVELTDPEGRRSLSLWADESFGWLHLYTGDDLDEPRRRRALAVEPLTCPPDALNSGVGLTVLEPGEVWSGTWGIVPRTA